MTGVELLVVGWFASPVIKSVVEKANNYLSANKELRKDTQEMVETLNSKLLLCQATVEEAEKRMINNSNLTAWLKMLKEAVYDADDVLDDMLAKSIKARIPIQAGKNKVSEFAENSLSGIKNMFLPDQNHKSLKKVVCKMSDIINDIKTFVDLVKMNENYGSNNYELISSDPRETISQSLGDPVGLHGRQEELDLILEMILGPELGSRKKGGQPYNTYPGLLVVPIVGVGGVGKTALAQAVYNNPEVQKSFERIEWISVSYNLEVVMLLRKLIQSLGGYLRSEVITLEYVSKNLSSIISGLRCLFILDGMFEKTEYQWDVIHTTLAQGAPGSVLLVTTQNQAFANRVATFCPVALNPLDWEIFWELFKRFAFGNAVIAEETRDNLERIGTKIAKKLHGLPLAAKIIGKILRCNIDENKWRTLSRSEWWDIGEGKSQILPSIGVGYQHLDPCLRQCFAFCSVFPRNILIEKDRLIQMWIAQNFIPDNSNGTRPEDVGNDWFDKLVNMSFFQPAWDSKSYIVPNLMHDLAVIVSSDECFYLSDHSQEIPRNVRHLAVDTKNLELVKRIQMYNKLRSFLYFGLTDVDELYITAMNNTLCKLDRIRVLDLSYLHMETKEPPKAIQSLSHLRFLDLSSTGIKLLSHSFDHYHLQALYARKCQFRELPRGINKLINLRHLNVDDETIRLISGIGYLTSLQKLDRYPAGEQEGHKISELKNLRDIRGFLKIDGCENIKRTEEAMQANLSDKKHLDAIELRWSNARLRKSNTDLNILEGLKPHEHINELFIVNYLGSSLPDWIMSHFRDLQKLELRSCLSIEILPPLGQLPSLKLLHLEELSSVKVIDHNFYGNNQTIFPVLREFRFRQHNCKEWIEPPVPEFFPNLWHLEIICCYMLREVPFHCFGASLKVLKIEMCENLNSLDRTLDHLSSLTVLHIGYVYTSFSLILNYLMLLEELFIWNCHELSIVTPREVPFHRFGASLKVLKISSCRNLNSLDRALHHLSSLTVLHIISVGASISLILNYLILLEELHLLDCPELSIEGNIQLLTNLKSLRITGCPKLLDESKLKGKGLDIHQGEGLRSLVSMKMDFLNQGYHLIVGKLSSLRVLTYRLWQHSQFTTYETLWFQELTNLRELSFVECEIEHLPSSLATLLSLKKMRLDSCTKLQSLPANGMPPFLWDLTILRCSQNLVQRCQPDKGEDWPLISHVPLIRIEGRIIHRPQSSEGSSDL